MTTQSEIEQRVRARRKNTGESDATAGVGSPALDDDAVDALFAAVDAE